MEFIDNTGHVFSLKSYEDNPVALQYTENDYIFWVKDTSVSINNYYIKPIKFLIDYNEIQTSYRISKEDAFDLEISNESQFFKLIGPKYIQGKLEKNKNLNENITLDSSQFKDKLTLEDFYFNIEHEDESIIVSDNNTKFYMFPFYVVGKSEIEGTFLNNIMIKTKFHKRNESNVKIKLDSDDMYDYYMKNIVSDINIYEVNLNTGEKKLWYTIPKGYDRNTDEILYPSYDDTYPVGKVTMAKEVYSSLDEISKPYEDEEGNIIKPENMIDRVTHFQIDYGPGLPVNVFVYIHNLPMNKWLLGYDNYEREEVLDNEGNTVKDKDGNVMTQWKIDPNTNWFITKDGAQEIEDNDIIYTLDGSFERSCHYCGSVIKCNFDGSSVKMPKNAETHGQDGSIRVTEFYDRTDSNKHNGIPLYPEDWQGDECKKMFINTSFDAFGKNMEGGGYIINPPRDDNAIAAINLGDMARRNENTDQDGVVIKSGDQVYDKRPIIIRDFWFDIDITLDENIYESELVTTYTPITVGCSFIDECEELIINGKNMGIRLPKEILKAIYNSSFYSKYPDEKLLRNKLKEYLLNYMNIKGECGNFKSVYNSLKWFGWSDNIEISKLLKTDNEFQDQYILDYFSINNDIKETFKYFNNTNLITLSVKGNIETGINDIQNYNVHKLIGEGKPLLEDLFSKNIEVIKEDISFYKPYYNFIFTELALKLDCLRYYYQKYFLPVHIKINRASIEYKVYANTLKFNSYAHTELVERPIYIPETNISVEFPEIDTLLFCKTKHFIDRNFNEFSNYDEDYTIHDLYYVNENNITIPIKIIDKNNIYSLDNNTGKYIKDGDDYILIKYFYKLDADEETAIECGPEEAELYKIDDDSEILEIEDIQRYSKISSGYFNCRLYLTATIKKQDDLGHYVFINNEYIYKENFYKSDLETIKESGNYIKYYGEFIKIDKSDRYSIETVTLIDNNQFNFYQKISEYYKNLIIIPRILNNNIDLLNSDFRLSLLINNHWFYYDFRIKVPNIYLDLGKLKYRYNVIDNNDSENTKEFYPFKQLKSLNPLKFNSFMYQPDLITIDTLFKEEDEEGNTKLLTFIDKLVATNEDENKMYNFYKNYYANNIKIPYNKKYYNRIHLFDLYENGNKIEYNQLETNNTLYNDLFNSDLSCKFILNEKIDYDYYLMHDDKEWYIVAISQYPIKSYTDESLLDIHQNNYTLENYSIKYSNYSIDKFLVNRMDIIKANGFNHFDKRDLIVATVGNNDYQFNIDLNNKWEIQPIFDINNKQLVKSNTNIMIIPTKNIDNIYSIGYYNIELNYTINGLDNKEYKAITKYKVEDNLNIDYPIIIETFEKPKKISYTNKISDFGILYENANGKRIITTDIVDPSRGYHPIGIKVINTGYFGPEQKWSVFIGLKYLDAAHPDTGYSGLENPSIELNNPYYGFTLQNINIETLPLKLFAGYLDAEHNEKVAKNEYQFFIPTDYKTSSNSIDGEFKWPTNISGTRGWISNPINSQNYTYYNFLNDDDSLNMDLLDNECAIMDYNGYYNTQKIIDEFVFDFKGFAEGQFPQDERTFGYYGYQERGQFNEISDSWKKFVNQEEGWKKSEVIWNFNGDGVTNRRWSPMAACSWRYHTIGTKQGDWYIPAYGEIMCMSLNYAYLSELFIQLANKYPDDCNPTLFSGLAGNAAWSSTQYNPTLTWEIHPSQTRCHAWTKSTGSWKTIPYIRMNDKTLKVYRD